MELERLRELERRLGGAARGCREAWDVTRSNNSMAIDAAGFGDWKIDISEARTHRLGKV